MKKLITIVTVFSISLNAMQKGDQSIQKVTPHVRYSKITYSKDDNDYAIHATINGKQIGHVTYGPTKNPHVPTGTWTIKSIRVAPEYLKHKIGSSLFSKALTDIIKRKDATHISINAVPRLESPISPETLVDIYIKMITRFDPKLYQATTVRPWPSDPTYRQIIITLK